MNHAPQITAPAFAEAYETNLFTLTVAASDSDATDTLTVTVSDAPSFLIFGVTYYPDSVTATIGGTPAYGDDGQYLIKWTVSDGKGGTATATTKLTVHQVLATPERVLMALERAYELRDSVRTKWLYDDSYQGTSFKLDGSFYSFTKHDEITHVAHLVRSPSVHSVVLDLGSPASWTRFTGLGDPPGQTRISVSSPDVSIKDWNSGKEFTLYPNQVFEFTMEPTTPAQFSLTDTTWQIIRWVEYLP